MPSGTVDGMRTVRRAGYHTDLFISVIQQPECEVIGGFFFIVYNGRDVFIFGDTVGADKFRLGIIGERDNDMTVATDINNPIHLFCQHIFHSGMNE